MYRLNAHRFTIAYIVNLEYTKYMFLYLSNYKFEIELTKIVMEQSGSCPDVSSECTQIYH